MSDAWRPYTEPQKRLDAMRTRALRAGGSAFVDLGYANSWDGPSDAFRAALHDAVDADDALGLQYTPYGGSTLARRVAAQALTDLSGVSFKYADIVLTPGAMGALSLTLGVLGERGGNVVIPTPTWLDHPLYAAHQGLEPRLVPLQEPDFSLDIDAIANAIDADTRAVLITHPGNPSGVLHSAESLKALGALLEDRDAVLISDECHRDYVFDGDTFEPAVRHVPRTITIYSYGKRFLAQGQRLGYAAVSPAIGRAFAEELTLRARVTGMATPTALMQRALEKLERLGPAVDIIGARRKRVVAQLLDMGLEVGGSTATMFVYARAPRGDDWAFAEALATRGVLVCPAGLFHARGWFRLSVSATDEMLERGLAAIQAELLAPRPRPHLEVVR